LVNSAALLESEPVAKKKASHPKGKVKSKRVRSRPGSVMVDLGPRLKRMLEMLRDKRELELRATGDYEAVTLSSMVRGMVQADFDASGLEFTE
jgi:hypothetical protein